MNERETKLLQVVCETKNALYAEWMKKRCFKDNNKFKGSSRGILSESMGLTSVMLLYNSFVHAKEVYEMGINDPETVDIIKTSMNYIYQAKEDGGYTVAPIRKNEETAGIIDKENAYVDTLTWVLSSSVLTVYAIREKLLFVDDDLEKMAIELIADSLARLLDGQLESGAWGFSTNCDCSESLYFTYAAAASLADFLDYILGELKYYSNEENQKKPIESFYDTQTLDAINSYYRNHSEESVYPKIDVVEKINMVKSKLQMWLLTNCLPLLPKIADCQPLSDEEMARVGMQRQIDNTDALGGKDYINLYYAYYIIDILTTSSSDKRYHDIMEGRDDKVDAGDLKKMYWDSMVRTDYEYFFDNDAKSVKMFNEYIDQAIHSARTNFGKAMRIHSFWDDESSELIIKWGSSSTKAEYHQGKVNNARGPSKKFTEPALIPMALRANTVYCFYITGCSDVTVDNLFDLICQDKSEITGETDEGEFVIKDLWDGKSYSLPITERAIEALVDYSDYLIKTVDENVKAAEDVITVSVDDAIERKIERFLASDEGSKLLKSKGYVHMSDLPDTKIDEEYISKIIDARVEAKVNEAVKDVLAEQLETYIPETQPSASSAASSFSVDRFVGELESVQRFLDLHDDLPNRESDNNYEKLAHAFLEIHLKICDKALLKAVLDAVGDPDTAQALSKQLEELKKAVIENCKVPEGNLRYLYSKLMQ